jgi:general secretion pathway protein G
MATLRRRQRRGGFTLIEVLLVLTILVILASLVVANYGRIQSGANIKATRTQINAFKTPLQAYRMDVGDYPSTNQGLEALISPPSDLANQNKWVGPYLDSQNLPKDPWGNPYQYEYPGKRQEIWPDIWSLGPDGQDGNDDDIGNWMVEE